MDAKLQKVQIAQVVETLSTPGWTEVLEPLMKERLEKLKEKLIIEEDIDKFIKQQAYAKAIKALLKEVNAYLTIAGQ